ncbi:family 69 glycosyltransferase [Podospora aff. communis PSN243]|uniref:Family 69 glycosyltransferase n=1 Tax=Podospora aff. communis PSN243 TaxID=3040156 RepID=A0AAV9G559_9PEZI|nr:family 69 glycosyltransferase [Podospora aff. communis PSN243]
MSCPSLNESRYSYLRPSPDQTQYEYIFALNLREIIDLTPRLLGSVIEAITFLGPTRCALSIVEGNSRDGTLEILRLLADPLAKLGTPYYLLSSPLDPSASERIKKLAILRALALEPITGPLPAHLNIILNSKEGRPEPSHPTTYWSLPHNPLTNATLTSLRDNLSPTAKVLFLNDVAACAEDLLELLHQLHVQSASLVCAMDWAHGSDSTSPDPYPLTDPIFFYDVWIARAINGDTFFPIDPATGSWEHATQLFPSEPVSRARMRAGLPFQVFSCWNGAVAFPAAPLVSHEIEFRYPRNGECYQGEAQLFCKDFWVAGHGKIAVVPSVNLEYTDARGRQTKLQKGYVSDFVKGTRPQPVGGIERQADEEGANLDEVIHWRGPPEEVKCMPTFAEQSWRKWNETLVEVEDV